MVTVDDVENRLPRDLDPAEKTRAGYLIEDAEARIVEEFGRAGMDLARFLEFPWFRATYERVVREMVAAPILVGINAGMRSASSSTMQESDSVTFADVESVSWGGVTLTDQQRADLGLPAGGLPRGRFPCPPRWPERRLP